MGTKNKSRAGAEGRWEENTAPWYEQTMVYCDTCGMLLPKRQFVVRKSSVINRFCGPECARLNVRGLQVSSTRSRT